MTAFFAYAFFVWMELIGFDNTQADFGVSAYLDRMAVNPQVISLLLDNDGLFLSHEKGLPADFAFPPNVASYRARPFNRERRRQTWTAFQLKGLVAELKKHGVNAVRGPRRMPESLLKELEAAARPEEQSKPKSRRGKRPC